MVKSKFDIIVCGDYSVSMSTTTKRSRAVRKASAAPQQRKKPSSPTRPGAKVVSGVVIARRMRALSSKVKPITVRLAPDLKRGMDILRDVLKRPVNKMINEAVQGFIQKRTAEVETDLEGMLSQIKAYKRRDPNFDAAFGRWADAEAKFGGEDPAEGVVVKTETVDAKAGPTQTLVRELLSR